jgi:hypothetical protein
VKSSWPHRCPAAATADTQLHTGASRQLCRQPQPGQHSHTPLSAAARYSTLLYMLVGLASAKPPLQPQQLPLDWSEPASERASAPRHRHTLRSRPPRCGSRRRPTASHADRPAAGTHPLAGRATGRFFENHNRFTCFLTWFCSSAC